MKTVTLDVANIEKIPNIAFSYFLNGLGTQGSTCALKKGHWHQVLYEIKKNAHFFSKYMIFNCNEI